MRRGGMGGGPRNSKEIQNKSQELPKATAVGGGCDGRRGREKSLTNTCLVRTPNKSMACLRVGEKKTRYCRWRLTPEAQHVQPLPESRAAFGKAHCFSSKGC